MKKTKIHLQSLLDNLQTFLGILDLDGTVIFINNTPLIAAGLEEKDVMGKKFWDCDWFTHDIKLQQTMEHLCNDVAQGKSVLCDILVKLGDNQVWIDFSMHPIFDEHGKVTQLVPEGRVIEERKRAEAELSKLNYALEISVSKRTKELAEANSLLKVISETDPLTKIGNRRFYDERLIQNIATATRNNDNLSLLMIDIDNFKNYNDHYGHVSGDIALSKIAHSISKSLPRVTDTVARFGGEEFVVLLPATDYEGAFLVAEKIRLDIKALGIVHEYSDDNNTITVSIGLTSLHAKNLNGTDLLNQADEALYTAKNNTRDCCEIFKQSSNCQLQKNITNNL